MNRRDQLLKRAFDLVVAVIGLLVFWPLIFVGWIAATISTRQNGFFFQKRVGYQGRLFSVVKLRSMKAVEGLTTTVTSDKDVRVTPVGWWLRKLKFDELPQLFNVLLGQMSFVGPRPDVPGFADKLTGEDRIVLTIRPGITGPATIAFRNEEELLAGVDDPESYNREVIWPEKVRLNKDYIRDYSLRGDIKYIWQTAVGSRS